MARTTAYSLEEFFQADRKPDEEMPVIYLYMVHAFYFHCFMLFSAFVNWGYWIAYFARIN
ncbi:hypothetical protein RchiOBHm_Chr7g0240791 [Rosa chinensis]|uniref:Uncharacterized protein n=1 Tax=Rosa chinensis TaxID=74649 RepID=A0A2P6PI35_ROSCH|nr:hypothetical protein RchiOBHm_Chr7g0240791 [Rosa chinensis]